MPITGQNQTTWGETFPSIVKNAAEMKAPFNVELPFTSYLQKLFPPGIFCGTNGTGYRLLPRTRFKSVSGSVITVSGFTAGLFWPGDVITQINLADGTAGTAVGTVQSINHAANTITLTAAPGTNPAVDTVIGVATSRPLRTDGTKLGIISPNTAINLDDTGRNPTALNNHFACIISGSFWRALAPHVDSELERLFPEMNFS